MYMSRYWLARASLLSSLVYMSIWKRCTSSSWESDAKNCHCYYHHHHLHVKRTTIIMSTCRKGQPSSLSSCSSSSLPTSGQVGSAVIVVAIIIAKHQSYLHLHYQQSYMNKTNTILPEIIKRKYKVNTGRTTNKISLLYVCCLCLFMYIYHAEIIALTLVINHSA